MKQAWAFLPPDQAQRVSPRQVACGAGDFRGGEERRARGGRVPKDTRFVIWLGAAV